MQWHSCSKVLSNFGEIHEEVKAPNYNTMEIFVPYGVPTIGSYHMTAFMDGIPITDKKTNYLPERPYGFYVTVVMSFGDFKGIKNSGKSFKKIWDAKGYEEKVRVIALNDDGVLRDSLASFEDALSTWSAHFQDS